MMMDVFKVMSGWGIRRWMGGIGLTERIELSTADRYRLVV